MYKFVIFVHISRMFNGIFLKRPAEPCHSVMLPGGPGLPNYSKIGDKPLLNVGLAGFDAADQAHIKGVLRLLPQKISKWRVSGLAGADALLVCGKNTRFCATLLPASKDILEVLEGSTPEKLIMLSLRSMNSPLAFSLPIAAAGIEPALSFDAASPASIQQVLQDFENGLWAKLAQFAVGKQLTERELDLRACVYHVLHVGKLLAIVDLVHFQIGLLSGIDPQLFDQAIWEKRPSQAATIPPQFLKTDVAKVRWVYAQHSQRDLLPGRYRHKPIYYRQPPQVVSAWLTDPQMRILHELASTPANFLQLVERLGVRHEDLAKDLACLYCAVSITTTASKAAMATADKTVKRLSDPASAVDTGRGKRRTRMYDTSMLQHADPLSLAGEPETTVAAQLSP